MSVLVLPDHVGVATCKVTVTYLYDVLKKKTAFLQSVQRQKERDMHECLKWIS